MEFLLQFEHFLNEEGLKYLERCKTYTIECLNKDLLIKVLGNIEINEIKNVPLVCKFWNTLFGTPEFWQPFVERKLKEFPLCVQNANVYFKHSGCLKYAFRWILSGKTKIDKDGDIRLGGGVIICLEKDQIKTIEYSSPTGSEVFRLRGLNPNLKYYHVNDQREVTKILYKTKDGIQFEGKSNDDKLKHDHEIYPHGQGTWTFPDGSTFFGDNVAFEGVPHGKGLWNGKEEVEFEFGKKVKEGHKRRKIEWE